MRQSVLLELKEAKNDANKRYLEEIGSSEGGSEEVAEGKEDMSRKWKLLMTVLKWGSIHFHNLWASLGVTKEETMLSNH